MGSFCYPCGSFIAACTGLAPVLDMDVAFLVFLILLNGVFAMSEMALTASRKARLQVMLEAGEARRADCHRSARQPDEVSFHGADRHYVDRHPERHRRRSGVRRPLADGRRRPLTWASARLTSAQPGWWW